MTNKNNSSKENCDKLQKRLEEARKKVEYYQWVAEEVGKRRLRETDQLSQFIVKQEKTKEIIVLKLRFIHQTDVIVIPIKKLPTINL